MAASTTSTALSLPSSASSSAPLIHTPKPPLQIQSQPCAVTRPNLPPPQSQSRRRSAAAAAHDRNTIVRDLRAMATATGEAPADVATTEQPEIIKTVQEAWDRIEEKYAVAFLAVAGIIAFSALTGMVSAIDRLPLVPGVLELVGIGCTGWFAYRNLIFKPDREGLLKKIKGTYEDIIGSS